MLRALHSAIRRRPWRVVLLAAFLTGMAGCVPAPAPLSPESRRSLGRVGVVALSSTPRVEFQTFAKGWATGAAKGGAFGVVDGLVRTLGETVRNPPTGPYAGAAILITSAVLITVGVLAHSVAGGIEAVPARTSRQIEQEQDSVFGDARMAGDLARQIIALAAARPDLGRHAVFLLPPAGAPSGPGDPAGQGIDTVVDVQITEAGFRGGSGSQPRVAFYLNARIRLTAAGSNREIYTRDFQYLSRERPFADWFADGSRELRTDLGRAMGTLAERILDELFVVTHFPFPSGLWALPGLPEFGSCWFYPLYPEVHYTSLWDSIRHASPGIQIRYTTADSLQPQLRWEPFPRPRDRKPENVALLERIADVTYDLKIWEAAGDFPERLVCDVGGLLEPQYRPAVPLAQATKYFWTVRARYTLGGQPQVTRWAFSSIPSNLPSDYPVRQPGGTCDLDAIPSTNYFRFITP